MINVTLADRYEILMTSPLPELDTATAKAYEAQDLKAPGEGLYALQTRFFPVPRLSLVDTIFDLSNHNSVPGMLGLCHAANATWSEDLLERSIALVYQRPGAPLMRSLNESFTPWVEEQIMKIKLIMTIVNALQALHQKGISHHAVRPTNIFQDPASKKGGILLGECLSEPAGYGQHSLFEPLSLALADPISRGESPPSTDFFALGVTLCFLLNGGSPVDLSNEREITSHRIEFGSFATLLPKKQLSTGITDLLRGLLNDADDARWGLKEVTSWLNSGKVVQTNFSQTRKAARPITFNGRDEIYTPALLAYEMRSNPNAALGFIAKNELPMWLKNGLNDHVRIHLLEELKAISVKQSPSEKLIGVMQILDKGTPMLWQGKSFTPRGFGNALAQAIITGDGLESYTNFIASPILSYYLTNSKVASSRFEDSALSRKIQQIRNTLEYQGMGGGIESCLYHLCQDIPCLSPNLMKFNALKIIDVVVGLNLLGMQDSRPGVIVDRHIAAFVAVREPNIPQKFFHEIDISNKFRKHVAVIKLLSELQQRYKLAHLQGLSKWVVDVMIPLLGQFKNIPLRQKLEKKLSELVESGNLKLIAQLLDNRKLIEMDRIGLRQAQAEAALIDKKVKAILGSFDSEKHYSESIGQNNAMILAAVFSLGFALFYIISRIVA